MIFLLGHNDLCGLLHRAVVLQPAEPDQDDHGVPQRRQQAAGHWLLPL